MAPECLATYFCRDCPHPQIKVGQLSVTDGRMSTKVSVNFLPTLLSSADNFANSLDPDQAQQLVFCKQFTHDSHYLSVVSMLFWASLACAYLGIKSFTAFYIITSLIKLGHFM